jgi:hypothetical protein
LFGICIFHQAPLPRKEYTKEYILPIDIFLVEFLDFLCKGGLAESKQLAGLRLDDESKVNAKLSSGPQLYISFLDTGFSFR